MLGCGPLQRAAAARWGRVQRAAQAVVTGEHEGRATGGRRENAVYSTYPLWKRLSWFATASLCKCSISLATLSMNCSMVQPSAVRCCRLWNGWFVDPFALCPAFPDSLGGRHSTDYYGSAVPLLALATYPPTLCREPRRFRRCSYSNFSVSFRNLSVILMTCEQARETSPHR